MIRVPSYLPPDEHELADADALVELYAERTRACRTLATKPRPTGADVDAVLAVGDQLSAACEAFRARWYPSATRVCVAQYRVLVIPAGWDTSDDPDDGLRVHLVVDLSPRYLAA